MFGLTTNQFVVMIVGTIYIFLIVVLFFVFLKDNKYFANLSEKEYPLKDVFFIGYGVLKICRYQYNSQECQKLKAELAILYEAKYADYYLRVVQSQRLTYLILLVGCSFVIYGLSSEIGCLVVVFLMAGLAFYYYGDIVHQKIKVRSKRMLLEFSEVISEITLLINTGMVLREAWEIVSNNEEGIIYSEMKKTNIEIYNGMTESEAYTLFGERCVVPEIKKFASTLLQGMSKGNHELSTMLKEQNMEIWKTRKQSVEQMVNEASTKLVIPMCIMFIGILIIIIVPIFANLGI